MKIMDRNLFFSFLAAFAICFSSMVGLYIVIDLFSNADEFLEDHAGTVAFARRAGKYYFVHSFEYFDRLSPVITMIAAMVTLASLHRHNELVAMLAAGVPTRRVLIPILFGSLVVIALGTFNREVILPANSGMLQRAHEDIETNVLYFPSIHMDRDQILFKAHCADRKQKRLEQVDITLTIEAAGQIQETRAKYAYYEPYSADENDPRFGKKGWRVVDPSPVQLLKETQKIQQLSNGDLFIFSDLSFTEMIRRHTWMSFASTIELMQELQNDKIKNPQALRTLIHNRLMQPVLNMLLVLIGIPFVLQWERRDVYRSIAISMILCGLFFTVDESAGYFANHGYLDSMTAAWVPVFVFGPVAFAMFHRVGT